MKRTFKHELLTSIITLMLSFSVLLGSTFAWFTDMTVSSINQINSGALSMSVSYKPFGASYTEWTTIDSKTKIFNEKAVFEPGYMEAVWIRVENTGTLGFKFKMGLDVFDEIPGIIMDDQKVNLSDHLVVLSGLETTDYVQVETVCADKDLLVASYAWDEQYLNTGDITVVNNINVYPKYAQEDQDDSTYYICMVLRMPDLGGTVANHIKEKIPQLTIGLRAKAMQVPYEDEIVDEDNDADTV